MAFVPKGWKHENAQFKSKRTSGYRHETTGSLVIEASRHIYVLNSNHREIGQFDKENNPNALGSAFNYVEQLSGNPITETILRAVAAERKRQDQKWNRSPGCWRELPTFRLAILTEEVGEVARALNDKQHLKQLRSELIQVAAVCVAWVEVIDNNNDTDHYSRSDVLKCIQEAFADTATACSANEKELLEGVLNRLLAAL